MAAPSCRTGEQKSAALGAPFCSATGAAGHALPGGRAAARPGGTQGHLVAWRCNALHVAGNAGFCHGLPWEKMLNVLRNLRKVLGKCWFYCFTSNKWWIYRLFPRVLPQNIWIKHGGFSMKHDEFTKKIVVLTCFTWFGLEQMVV